MASFLLQKSFVQCDAVHLAQLGFDQRIDQVDTALRAQHPKSLIPGGGQDPPRKCARLPEVVEVPDQLEPQLLANVVAITIGEPIPSDDG